MRSTSVAALLAVGLAIAQGVPAHHSQVAFDQTREILLEGALTQFALKNPHTYLTLEIVDPAGRRVLQDVEAGPVSTVQPLGLTQDSLRVGERVVIRAHPSKRGANHTVYGLDVTRADGMVFPLSVASASVRPASTAVATSIAGVWHPTFAGFAALYEAIGSWPLTDEGRRRLLEARRLNRTTQSECVPAGAPMLMVYPVVVTVDVSPTEVVFDFDWMNAQRVVHLGAERSQDLAPTMHGHSVGRWEDGVLVVDTVGFTAHEEGMGFAMPSSEHKRLLERFSLSDDRRYLVYEATIEDPTYLTRPVNYSTRWEYSPELEPSGVECDLEIARRYLREAAP